MNDDIMILVAADVGNILKLLFERLGIYYWDRTGIYLMHYEKFFKTFEGYPIEYGNGTAWVMIGDIQFKTYNSNGVGDE